MRAICSNMRKPLPLVSAVLVILISVAAGCDDPDIPTAPLQHEGDAVEADFAPSDFSGNVTILEDNDGLRAAKITVEYRGKNPVLISADRFLVVFRQDPLKRQHGGRAWGGPYMGTSGYCGDNYVLLQPPNKGGTGLSTISFARAFSGNGLDDEQIQEAQAHVEIYLKSPSSPATSSAATTLTVILPVVNGR